MQAEILLTLKLQGSLFADPRRIALLKQIKATGSISQGAKLAGISYKSAWDAINEMNQLTDDILVDRATGGKGGGGTTLTAYGERLLQLYDLLAKIQQKAFDVLKDDKLPLDSLLAAISRFSLQTSARNQFFGTLIARDHTHVQQHVQIRLADNHTVINAALTEQSANRLNLSEGKEVLALIKAPWVKLTKQQPKPAEFDNHLGGKITALERGKDNSEVIITLTGGETLCSTLTNSEVDEQTLRINDKVTALFNADQVIIATLC
ncbi:MULTISPECIES: molybdenum-dependent transcriptional regulator [Providencia]|uniref:molybdenum-dependent transcriptional regulator n=1 Tax=Providencia TaxID=586 RepID=UPI0008387920|nr:MULTISPECIES: molybdenum-dependent transcriptional regulator [Providencia]MBP6121039.1 molybdenum-dependent transcriptional regulator [Providencia sp.]MDD9338487.1 molybdenum-dependent transcriptional regulator [Providencia heimbachae]NIH23581.1 molybdenum-dependent transcriptional regulator [Providencia heimbachae]QCJ71042.1 molybdenum-dependent transcriptional regulator [Providencia heimbachae]